jgi:hypothetical protein
MIQFLGLVTTFGLIVLLPLHLTGEIPSILLNQMQFTTYSENFILLKTTISMVIKNHIKLYAHVVLSIYQLI